MISTIIILVLLAINQYSSQSITGSASVCGPRSRPAACAKGIVLRGESHIGIPSACFNKVDPGPCSRDLVRIYYDSRTYTCKAFSYSGCGGNANRFVSIKNCYKLCHPYYRQRFISLAQDKPSDNQILKPFDAKHEQQSQLIEGNFNVSNVSDSGLTKVDVLNNYSSLKLNQTEDNSTQTNTISKSDPTDEARHVQVVREHDTFAPSLQLPSHLAPYLNPYFGHKYGKLFRSMSNPSNNKNENPLLSQHKNQYLINVKHEDYHPISGYLLTRNGYVPQPIESQKTFVTNI